MNHICCHDHHHECSADFIVSQLEEFDEELKEKVKPKGSRNAISPEPQSVELDQDQIERAISFFQTYIEEFEDILYAAPEGIKPTEGAPLYEDIRGDWEWYYQEQTYFNPEIDEEVDQDRRDGISLTLLDLFIAYLLEQTASLIVGEITIQKWVNHMRNEIRDGTTAQYLFGLGGKNVIDVLDISALKRIIKSQWKFFQKFAEEIKNGELSGSRILQRIGMYGEAITNGYEQAKAKTYGIRLPEYPADGSQACLSNCRCHWQLKDDPKNNNYVLANWVLNPNAEHCVTCLNNSRKWNPLRVKKGA